MKDSYVKHNNNREDPIDDERVRRIVKEVLKGDAYRFEEIFDLFRGRIYGLSWSLTGNREDALDVVQESFIRAFRALKSWKGRSKFSTWLHRIVVNTAIDFIRREAKHHNKRVTPGSEKEADEKFRILLEGVDEKTAVAELERRDLRKRLFQAINKLPGSQKRSFILRYFGELTVKDISDIIGCGEGTTKRQLFRAREKLKKMLSLD